MFSSVIFNFFHRFDQSIAQKSVAVIRNQEVIFHTDSSEVPVFIYFIIINKVGVSVFRLSDINQIRDHINAGLNRYDKS